MIFITVGSQKFQFDRLLKKTDELVEKRIFQEEIFAQTGTSKYVPVYYDSKTFLNKKEFENAVSLCSIVITHGGTGSIISAVKNGKKVIGVARLKRHAEAVDDHQVQLLEQFSDMGIIEYCRDLEQLGESYLHALKAKYKPYVSNTEKIICSINEYIETL